MGGGTAIALNDEVRGPGPVRALWHQLRARIHPTRFDPWHMGVRWLQAFRHGRELTPVQDYTKAIRPGHILLFSTLRNEAIRMPWFLDYYRKLGVDHFLLIDNDSDDGFMDVIGDAPDVSVWHTTASYRAAHYGVHWLNYLLRRYGDGHWCVTCDPDEFLVYPNYDERNLRELATFLELEDRRSLCCLMLDMYSDCPVEETVYTPGDDPFQVAPYFDGDGYVQEQGLLQDVYTRGGVRRRVFFRDVPDQAPALNKTPFVKWRWTYSYFMSMHQLVPSWLNIPHPFDHNSPTGCLMHFKYFSLLREKAAEEMRRGEHFNNSFEYRRYDEHLRRGEFDMMYEGSVKFTGWKGLVDRGLMNQGQWF